MSESVCAPLCSTEVPGMLKPNLKYKHELTVHQRPDRPPTEIKAEHHQTVRPVAAAAAATAATAATAACLLEARHSLAHAAPVMLLAC